MLALASVGCGPPSPPVVAVHDAHGVVDLSPTPSLGRFGGAIPTRAEATPTRPGAEVEFKWGQMDPMMMEHDDGSMARPVQGLSGVISAEASDWGVFIRYDPELTDPVRLRTGLIQANLPIAD